MKPARKRNRVEEYDYSLAGSYFVTICTAEKQILFGTVVGATVLGRPHVDLTPLGKMVEDAINYYNENDTEVSFDCFVVMPNHVHAIISIQPDAGDRGRSPLQYVVRRLKSYVTKQAGFSPWQKGFHEHIIRNQRSYDKIYEYIENNPITWKEDCYFAE